MVRSCSQSTRFHGGEKCGVRGERVKVLQIEQAAPHSARQVYISPVRALAAHSDIAACPTPLSSWEEQAQTSGECAGEHTRTDTHTLTKLHTLSSIHTHTHIPEEAQARERSWQWARERARKSTRHTYMFWNTYVWYSCMYVCIHIYIYVYTYIYIWIH